jgi:hypothetical protein
MTPHVPPTNEEWNRLLDATETHNREWCTCDDCEELRNINDRLRVAEGRK